MKPKFIILLGVALSTLLISLLSSCTNEEQDGITPNYSESENILIEYADAHNLGLDYIKSEIHNSHGICDKEFIESAFDSFIIIQYGKNEASKISRELAPMKDLMFCLETPLTLQTRGNNDNIVNQVNPIAYEALNECTKRISEKLANISDENLFDNSSLLNDLHSLINDYYNTYIQKYPSDIDTQAIAQVLGILYGSIEYWTNSNNVNFWSNVELEGYSNCSAGNDQSTPQTRADEKKKDDKTLSKSDYIITVASADAIGGLLSGPGAVLASGAAALYFDVE